MTIRYMGTKRHMAHHVRSAIEEIDSRERLVDLFAGMGSVTETLQNQMSVIANDALSFVGVISSARFTGRQRCVSPESVLDRLHPHFIEQRNYLRERFATELKNEVAAMQGGQHSLLEYMTEAKHVGNDRRWLADAKAARFSSGRERFCLASLYFSAGYFSLRQAIEVDSLRYSIEMLEPEYHRDWLLAAWLCTASAIMNAPGHSAQFLKPSSAAGFSRVMRSWKRSTWDQYMRSLLKVSQVGSNEWRSKNEVFNMEAIEFIGNCKFIDIGAVYADPPYTKDQYSRFYHVYETLYRYDFPDSRGEGRNRSDGFSTGFSLKTQVVGTFHDLCRQVANKSIPLVVSYPSEGLLHKAGWDFAEIASSYFESVTCNTVEMSHSTMGASRGESRKSATENIYVCRP